MKTHYEIIEDTTEKIIIRPQILTTDDLKEFQAELLEEIKKLLRQSGLQPAKKWLKSPELRKMLGISPGTLQNLRINGTLPFTKIGGVMFYDFDDIQKMLLSNKYQQTHFK